MSRKTLKCMGTPPCLVALFSKGDNFCDFLFPSMANEILSNRGLLLKERICSRRANSSH